MPTAASGSVRPIPPRLTLLAALMLFGGCSVVSAPETVRGNRIDAYRLQELVPGTSTQADATALIGSPTAKATFDSNTWLYITEATHIRIARTLGVEKQAVVILTFDDRGVLRGIQKLDQDDSLPVTVDARTTPSPGTEASFLQQLFGNIGRFSPASSSPSPGGGSPTGG